MFNVPIGLRHMSISTLIQVIIQVCPTKFWWNI